MLNKKVKVCFIFALLLSIGFPCGIVMIILHKSASNLATFVLILGIVLTAVGFYGMPLLWVKYGELKTKQKLLNQIVIDNLQEVDYLAKINNCDNQQMISRLHDLINNRYLTGYQIVDDKYIVKQSSKTITKDDAMQLSGQTQYLECKGCGATVALQKDEKTYCPYCGRVVSK